MTVFITIAYALISHAHPQDDAIRFATWDRLFIKPELPINAVVKRGCIRLLLYHSYPAPLHNVQFRATSKVLEVRFEPPVLKELKPTLIVGVDMHLKRNVALKPDGDIETLKIHITAEEVTGEVRYEVKVPLTKEAEQRVNESMFIPIGAIELRISRFGAVLPYIYWSIIIGLLALWLWRRLHIK